VWNGKRVGGGGGEVGASFKVGPVNGLQAFEVYRI